ncbi:MAG: SAP domain-containing protein [Ignavibacteria bacterium]
MKLNDVRAIARQRKVSPGRLPMVELVRAIQRHEGNNDCYATPSAASCGQEACLWRRNCTALLQSR